MNYNISIQDTAVIKKIELQDILRGLTRSVKKNQLFNQQQFALQYLCNMLFQLKNKIKNLEYTLAGK